MNAKANTYFRVHGSSARKPFYDFFAILILQCGIAGLTEDFWSSEVYNYCKRTNMPIIVPAILTDDEKVYQESLLKAEHVCNLIQVDIVDGKFAASQTIGAAVVAKYLTNANLEINLMVKYPQNYVDDFVKIDHVSRVILPWETESNHQEYIYHIKNHSKQVGLSINPATPVGAILHFLDDIDLLLLLAVEPGFQGQEFKREVLDKVSEVKKAAPGLAVEIDGGIRFENAKEIAKSGADFISAGSILYKAPDFFVAWDKLVKQVA